MSDWYKLNRSQVLEQFGVEPQKGLSQAEIEQRLAQDGPNELEEGKGRSPWKILWEQLTSVMVVILIIAAIISAILGDLPDAVAILAIVVLNAALGFQQELKAEKSMSALKRMAIPIVRVRREGQVREILSRELVAGDVLILETGNLVPADGRVLESINMRVQEAALTGESEPIEKDAGLFFDVDKPLGDRRNMVYMGTVVNYGRGEALITETGMRTELGGIARMLQSVEQEKTPLQKRLDRVGKVLAGVALGIVTVIFIFGIARGEPVVEMFETAVSLAVAAVPEALPAVATIALALGAQRMLKRNALIRKLAAVETLGSVSVICSDKTGTLTKNQMSVTVLDIANHRLELNQQRDPSGLVLELAPNQVEAPGLLPTLDLLLMAGALCNDSALQTDLEHSGSYRAVGDPTETALVLAAAEFSILKPDLEQALPRVAEAPFDSMRKRMTTVHRTPAADEDIPPSLLPVWERRLNEQPPPYMAFTKGAIDGMLSISDSVLVEGKVQPLTPDWKARIMAAHDGMAKNGMRILGLGVRPMERLPEKAHEEELEKELILLGLVGMIDPPRPEVKEAVETTRAAGIRTVMITGDHPLTARHIASQLGIISDDRYLTGQDLDSLTHDELLQASKDVRVFARVSPKHKLDLIDVFSEQGAIVAMTGDGVNDAPALKSADIGVAMGITGTDVAKEASDMVLLDDNFATIVSAVEEGRVIYANIRKFIKYLLSCNSAEIMVMLVGPFLGMPLPLLPLQILWMNLVTDGLPALALGVEPGEKDIMRRPPVASTENIFDWRTIIDILWAGLLMAIVSLAIGYFYWSAAPQEKIWQTMVFTTLVFSQMAMALSTRAERASIFKVGFFGNPSMIRAILLTFLLQIFVIYLPVMQGLFELAPLTPRDLGVALLASVSVFVISEIVKWIFKPRAKE